MPDLRCAAGWQKLLQAGCVSEASVMLHLNTGLRCLEEPFSQMSETSQPFRFSAFQGTKRPMGSAFDIQWRTNRSFFLARVALISVGP